MKKHYLQLSVLMMAFALVFTSCEKDEDEEPTPLPQTAPSNLFSIEGSDATLIAINSKSVTQTPIGSIPVTIGTAVAVFYEDGAADFIDAGTVSINDGELSKQANNSYVYIPGFTQPNGLEFTNGVEWVVDGSAAVSGFTFTQNASFPDAGEVLSGNTVNRSTGYTLTVDGVSGADSVLFQIGGVHKMLGGNITSCEFTADDLSSLNPGTNVAQAAPITFQNADINGKNVFFIKELVVTKTVTIE